MTLLNCTNRGCFQQGEHKLDLESNNVICEYCGGEVAVTDYMKKILKNSKQILKRVHSSKEITCNSCGAAGAPVVIEYLGGKAIAACRSCKQPHQHLTKYFVEALKLNPEIEKLKLKVPFPTTPPKAAKPTKAKPVSKAVAKPKAAASKLAGPARESPIKAGRATPKSAAQMQKLAAAKEAQADAGLQPKAARPKPKTAKELLDRVGVKSATLPEDAPFHGTAE